MDNGSNFFSHNSDIEPASEAALKTVFESFSDLPLNKPISLNSAGLEYSIERATAIDFNKGAIDSLEISRSLAEIHVATDKIIPEAVTLAIKGWFTSGRFADGRIISISIF